LRRAISWATATGDAGSAAIASSMVEVGARIAKPASPTRRIEICTRSAPTASTSGALRLSAMQATRTSANVKASEPSTGVVKKKTEPRRNAVWTDWSTRM
jgi:hypothetical protein